MAEIRKKKLEKIGIIMGSDSDLAVMQDAARTLDSFGISYEMTVVSAHRTPERLYAYAKGARARGIRAIIAGAGGSAHLPGMVASLTPLPVIGVPIKTSAAAGIDSLFSIVQMPAGIPVATVAINGGVNAGLLAVAILAANNSILLQKIEKYKKSLKNSVLKKASRLEKQGFARYLKEHLQ